MERQSQPRPYHIEYFRNKKLVKKGRAVSVHSAVRAAVRTIHGDDIALFAQVYNGNGIVKATVTRKNKLINIFTK